MHKTKFSWNKWWTLIIIFESLASVIQYARWCHSTSGALHFGMWGSTLSLWGVTPWCEVMGIALWIKPLHHHQQWASLESSWPSMAVVMSYGNVPSPELPYQTRYLA
jgi:hypothetical protein